MKGSRCDKGAGALGAGAGTLGAGAGALGAGAGALGAGARTLGAGGRGTRGRRTMTDSLVRGVILVVLVVQTSALVLTLRYTRYSVHCTP